jgi:hypothetical protein
MNSLKWRRIATGLAALGLSALTMSLAGPLICISLAELEMDEEGAARAASSMASKQVADVYAIRHQLSSSDHAKIGGEEGVEETVVEAERRIALIEALLRVTPTASDLWLQLAANRLLSGAQPDEVLKALALSEVTGPNERHMMAARASFALPLYADLPEKVRGMASRDLVGGWSELKFEQREFLRLVLARAPDDVRQDLRARLVRIGAEVELIITALGLADTPGNHPQSK